MKFSRKKNESYYRMLLSRYNSLAAYSSLFNHSGLPQYSTSRIIGENNEVNMGDSLKSIRKKKGKPLAKIRSRVNDKVCILFYKDIIGKFKVRQEYHFFEGKLFSYIYNFPYAIDEDHHQIRTILLDKYLKDNSNKNSHLIIRDRNNHFIKLHENVNIVVNYVDASSEMRDFVEGKVKRKQQAMIRFQQKREFLIQNCL